jgi:WD40 repeat protein
VWDGQAGQEVLTIKGHTSGVLSVAYSLASGSTQETVKLWDAQTN